MSDNDQMPEPLKFKMPEGKGRKFKWRGDRLNVCKHDKGVLVDARKRTLECETCGAVVDPFDLIVLMAKWEDRLDARLEAMRQWEVKIAAEKKRRALICRHFHLYSNGNGDAECMSCGTVFAGLAEGVERGYRVKKRPCTLNQMARGMGTK